mmetsp:Transcript_5679/g.12391  ORF Transcript_5679/g.12391 Transcript_5679/m.12391 type:complete len:91 (-) Transcript_5679:1389-1661(-)
MKISSAPIAATTKMASEFNVAKYLIWKMTVKMNQATGIEKKISKSPTNARNQLRVLRRIQRKTKTKLKIARVASLVTMFKITSPMIAVIK